MPGLGEIELPFILGGETEATFPFTERLITHMTPWLAEGATGTAPVGYGERPVFNHLEASQTFTQRLIGRMHPWL